MPLTATRSLEGSISWTGYRCLTGFYRCEMRVLWLLWQPERASRGTTWPPSKWTRRNSWSSMGSSSWLRPLCRDDFHGLGLAFIVFGSLHASQVLLERRRRREEWRSPLSGRPRYMPLLLRDPHLEKLRSRRGVVSLLTRALGSAQLGRVELTRQGWLVDVPRSMVPLLLEDKALRVKGVAVSAVPELPQLLEAAAPRRTRRRRPKPARRAEGRREAFLYPAGRRSLFGALERACWVARAWKQLETGGFAQERGACRGAKSSRRRCLSAGRGAGSAGKGGGQA